jgi:hypothetical protein
MKCDEILYVFRYFPNLFSPISHYNPSGCWMNFYEKFKYSAFDDLFCSLLLVGRKMFGTTTLEISSDKMFSGFFTQPEEKVLFISKEVDRKNNYPSLSCLKMSSNIQNIMHLPSQLNLPSFLVGVSMNSERVRVKKFNENRK